MAADSLNKNVHLDSENKDLLETVEEFKLKVFTPDSEIQNLKEGKYFVSPYFDAFHLKKNTCRKAKS